MTNKLKILSTKKIKENLKKNYDFQIFDYDFLKISFCLDEKKLEKIFENKKNIFIFTSSYAVKAVLNFLENNEKKYDLKAFAIEGKTNLLLEKSGFKILATGKNSLDLAKKIIKKNIAKNQLIHLTTKNHLQIMKNFLSKKNIELKTINVYEKKFSPKKIDFDYDAILFFSPSTIDSFFLKNFLKENVIVFCIGETTKKYFLEKNMKNKIITAKKSVIESLLETVKNYFKN